MPKYNIDWSVEATDTFKSTFSYLVEEFNLEVAYKFRSYTYELLTSLADNNKLCPTSIKINIRRCVLHKNTSLVYTLIRNKILLVTFIDNRTEHKY